MFLKPIVTHVFNTNCNTPGRGPPKGSKAWIEDLVKNPQNASFEDMVNYPRVLRAYIQDMKDNHSDFDNVILLRDGESTHIDDRYELHVPVSITAVTHVLKPTVITHVMKPTLTHVFKTTVTHVLKPAVTHVMKPTLTHVFENGCNTCF